MTLELSDVDNEMLDGGRGAAASMAMRLLVRVAEASGAGHMLEIQSAHLVGCFYTGQVGLDFARRLDELGARVAVPTTLNTGAVDLARADAVDVSAEFASRSRELMGLYRAMGAQPLWTCAPYQAGHRPPRGAQVAWGESNAVVFANSVLGARTERYGDFVDVAAALTGRVPAIGLHLDDPRLATVQIDVDLPDQTLNEHAVHAVLGYLIGQACADAVPVIRGLPAEVLNDDALKAIGASAAASGGVGMIHVVGTTPEATTLAEALGGRSPRHLMTIGVVDLRRGRDELTTQLSGESLGAVCLGTPHFSLEEFATVADFLDGRDVRIPLYISTNRATAWSLGDAGLSETFNRPNIHLLTDTCTYFPGVLPQEIRLVMTNSGKWAYYGPGNLGGEVVFGLTRECVESAVAGAVVRDESAWGTDA